MQENKNIKSYTWSLLGAAGTQVMMIFSFMPKEFLDKKLGIKGRLAATVAIVFIGLASLFSFIKAWTVSKIEKCDVVSHMVGKDVLAIAPLTFGEKHKDLSPERRVSFTEAVSRGSLHNASAQTAPRSR